jgi:hypothetical protein
MTFLAFYVVELCYGFRVTMCHISLDFLHNSSCSLIQVNVFHLYMPHVELFTCYDSPHAIATVFIDCRIQHSQCHTYIWPASESFWASYCTLRWPVSRSAFLCFFCCYIQLLWGYHSLVSSKVVANSSFWPGLSLLVWTLGLFSGCFTCSTASCSYMVLLRAMSLQIYGGACAARYVRLVPHDNLLYNCWLCLLWAF